MLRTCIEGKVVWDSSQTTVSPSCNRPLLSFNPHSARVNSNYFQLRVTPKHLTLKDRIGLIALAVEYYRL